MKPKAIKITYWILTILFAMAMLGDAYGGITQQQAGKDALAHLGYPMYNLVLFGVAKLLGVLAILQPMYRTIKEWAYAGFAFNFISAFASRAIVGDEVGLLIPPLVMLIFLLVAYYFWKKYEEVKTVS